MSRRNEGEEINEMLTLHTETLSIQKTITLLSDGALNQSCRDKAAAYAMEFDWSTIFDGLQL